MQLLNVFENYERPRLGVNESTIVNLLMYYRFVNDYHYANFEIIYQKVSFIGSLISLMKSLVDILNCR